MHSDNIILTGFMGTGKSAAGRLLAGELGMRFVDTDELVEQRAGRSIAEIFASDGEAAFRELETQVAEEFAAGKGAVIATGGGMMLNPHNVRILAAAGPIFCLTADLEQIVARIQAQDGSRPLTKGPDLRRRVQELLNSRAPVYSQFVQIDSGIRSPEAVAVEIVRLLQNGHVIQVNHPLGQYPVIIGTGLLVKVREMAAVPGALAIVTDINVGPLFAAQLGADEVISMPAGEQFKTLDTAGQIYRDLVSASIDRHGTILALGGGVVGDVAGFVAATYLRGVPFIQCPTSLLSMVDASVGGKTGVDLPDGKNLVGAFKQPQAVFADLQTLASLPQVEFAAGMAEVIKSGMIGDAQLFELVEARSNDLRDAPSIGLDLLGGLVSRSIEVKRRIVEEDPYESGRRAALNLGHTFGHAMERASDYRIRHGEAVAIGLVAATQLSAMLGYCPPDLETRLTALLKDIGLPVRIPEGMTAAEILNAMSSDKKKAAGKLRFILPRALGDVFISDAVNSGQVLAVLHAAGAA